MITDTFEGNPIGGVVLRHCVAAGVLGLVFCSGVFGGLGAAGAVIGVEMVAGDLPLFDAAAGRVRNERPGDTPPRFLLSRARYWAEDGHLDALVRLTTEEFEAAPAALRAAIHGDDGRELSAFEISPLPGRQFIAYPAIPPGLADGGTGEIRLALVRRADGAVIAEEQRAFRVERHPGAASVVGRIALRLPNENRLHAHGVPVSVGVPFPRTARLADAAHVRLVTPGGEEVPVQVTETARWSRYGPIKWLRCDFSADLAGEPREFLIEYGPQIRRRPSPGITVRPTKRGFPEVDAGRLRVADGLWQRAGTGSGFAPVLGARALAGGFVEHEDGRVYRMPADAPWEIEEDGPERVVLRQAGWYRETGGARTFCRYLARWVIYRDSPVARLVYTWIFTGDGNHDRIRNMGWEFPLADGVEPAGFLSGFEAGSDWLSGDHLVQYDYDRYEIGADGRARDYPGGRAAGAAAAAGPGGRLFFGARDFWQNYPAELEFRDGALWFHNWPRHGKPPRHGYDHETLEPAEFRLNTVQLRFAHAGETLDFRLPQAYVDGPIWEQATRGGAATHWDRNEPESVNAQGISRTEEFWLLLAPPETDPDEARRLLDALNQDTAAAFADPAWVAASGAFHEIHQQDPVNFPDAEAMFERFALGPALWRERLGIYGKWIYGDLPSWNLSLEAQTPDFYRAYMGTHHGWPYSWLPYARSGDPRLRRLADTWAGQMIDVNYCHHADEPVETRIGQNRHRRRGWLGVSLVPWTRYANTQTRCMLAKTDYLFHAWYLAGRHRAWDTVLDWAAQTKVEEALRERGPIGAGRGSVGLLQAYLETWEATFDPWFLAAAHAIGEMHLARWRAGAWRGHFFRTGDRDFHRFTGDEAYTPYYLDYAAAWGGHREPNSWMRMGEPWNEPNDWAWRLTGDDYHLGRSAYFVDALKTAIFTRDEPWYLQGYYTRVGAVASYTGWALESFPSALATVVASGRHPPPLQPNTAQLSMRNPVIILRKQAGAPLPLRLAAEIVRPDRNVGQVARYRVLDPAGGELLSGEWAMEQPLGLEVPGAAPAGEWAMEQPLGLEVPGAAPAGEIRFEVEFGSHSALEVPVSPPGTPEVILAGPDGWFATAGMDTQYYFMVPADLADFRLEIRPSGRQTIWTPDAEKAWDLAWHASLGEGDWRTPKRAEVAVAPGQEGRLWRVTLPGFNRTCRPGPGIPPVFATERDRWFLPENADAE